MKLHSSHLKTLGMCWLRFGKQMPIVATEAGHWNADVIGINATESIEIETKVSKQDLRIDHHKVKHGYFKLAGNKDLIPNRFFFLVPEPLEAAAIEECLKVNPDYGVLVAMSDLNYGDYHIHKSLRCVRRAKPLHDSLPTERLRLKIVRRMSSEICGFHLGNGYSQLFVDTLKSLEGTPDISAWDEAYKLQREQVKS